MLTWHVRLSVVSSAKEHHLPLQNDLFNIVVDTTSYLIDFRTGLLTILYVSILLGFAFQRVEKSVYHRRGLIDSQYTNTRRPYSCSRHSRFSPSFLFI